MGGMGGQHTTGEEREGSAGPIKRSHGCNCSTYSQQILIYGRAIKACINLAAAPPHTIIIFIGPLQRGPRFSVQH